MLLTVSRICWLLIGIVFVAAHFVLELLGAFGKLLLRIGQSLCFNTALGLTTNSFLNSKDPFDFLEILLILLDRIADTFTAIFALQKFQQLT